MKNKPIQISAQTVEKFYHLMLEEVIDYAILLLDLEGNILNWNRGAELIKGYTTMEIIGQNFTVFYTADDRQENLPNTLLREAKQNGRALHEGWRLKKNGEKFWGSVVITALHDEDNNVIGFSKLTRDLTERKAIEEVEKRNAMDLILKNEELRLSEERYHRMIAEVEDYAIILLSPEGNILNWNKGAEKIKGYKEHEIIGKNFRNFYLLEDRERGLPEQLLTNAAANNKATHEGWRLRKDGSHFWGSIVITAIHDDAGNITGFSKVTRDLTQKKQSEDFILMQNRHLEEFAYVASHDLQEPLRKITLFSNMLERNITNEEIAKQYLAKITGASDRMAKLISAVLEYSRSGNAQHLKENVDLNIVISDIKSDFELLLHERNATIISGQLPSIKGVPIQIHQLFSNLITNAIKFNEKSPKITITAEMETVNDKPFVTISVKDNGTGFNPEYAERIFHLFHRLDDKKSGTGIGLALCRRIVEAHRGTITASSGSGKGSTFTIVLPLD